MSFVLFFRCKGNERNLKVQGVRIKNATIMHASRVLHFFCAKILRNTYRPTCYIEKNVVTLPTNVIY